MIIRASRTLAAAVGNFAFGPEDFKEVVQAGLSISPVHEILIEESVLGWKEFELEVMRDHKRQRGHHLLHRKLRSHGRSHR